MPAYNEARSIRRTLELTRHFLHQRGWSYELLISADGTDGTREAAAEVAASDPRVIVLGEPQRGGKGRGIRLAVARASGYIIGFADADYKTPIEDLDKLLPWLATYDLVIGSRGVPDSNIEMVPPWYRQVGSKGFALGMHLLIGLWDIHDTQCGFKVFRGDVARDLFSRQVIDGYMFDVEILYLAKKAGYRIKEAGVTWRGDGDSRLQLVRGNWRNFCDLVKIRFGRGRLQSSAARVLQPKGQKYAA